MAAGSFLFLKGQIKDIIIISVSHLYKWALRVVNRQGV
jgi:hypothetical protein